MNTSVYPDATPWSFLAQIPGFPALFAALFAWRPLFRWQIRALFGLKDAALIDAYARVYGEPLTRRTMARIAASWTPESLARIAGGLSRLQCPVHLIWGMEDRYIFPFRPHGERFLRDFPGAGLTQITGAAHFVQAERPDQVLAALEGFLAT